MVDENIYFSKEGLDNLKAELNFLKTKKRKEIADRLEFAKSLGDLSENSEYQEAKESQILNETKIVELEDMLRRSVVVERRHGGAIDIGSSVALEDEEGKSRIFHIVGSNETSPAENKISHESPLGKALLGRKKYDDISVNTPRGVTRYKITDIK